MAKGKQYRLVSSRYRHLDLKEGKVVGSTRYFRGDTISFEDEEEERRLLQAGAIVPVDQDDEETESVDGSDGGTPGLLSTEDPTGSGADSGVPSGGSTEQETPDGTTEAGDPTVTSAPTANEFDPDTADYDDLKAYVAEHEIEAESQKKKDLIAAIKSHQAQS